MVSSRDLSIKFFGVLDTQCNPFGGKFNISNAWWLNVHLVFAVLGKYFLCKKLMTKFYYSPRALK